MPSVKRRRRKKAASVNGVTRFTMDLPTGLYEWVKEFAATERTSMATVFRLSLEEKRALEARKKRVAAFLDGGDGVDQI